MTLLLHYSPYPSSIYFFTQKQPKLNLKKLIASKKGGTAGKYRSFTFLYIPPARLACGRSNLLPSNPCPHL